MARPILTPDLSRDIRDMERRIVELERASSRNFSGTSGSSSGTAEVSILDYGGNGNGTFDNGPAIMAAKSALGSNGGYIKFPAGHFIYTPLNFDDTRNITLKGNGGMSGGGGSLPATTLTYAGVSSGITARSSHGFSIQDIWMRYTSNSHSGSLIDLGHSANAFDTQFATFERCLFGSGVTNIVGTGRIFSLDKAINTQFWACSFVGGNVGVRGAASGSSYSNNNRFFGCQWARMGTAGVTNPIYGWSFSGCTWQQLINGNAGGIVTADGTVARSLAILGGGCHDANSLGIWIDAEVRGLAVDGVYFGAGNTGINLRTNSDGIKIAGCRFDLETTAIALGSNVGHYDDLSNNYVLVTNQRTGVPAFSSLYLDYADNKLKYINSAGTINALY